MPKNLFGFLSNSINSILNCISTLTFFAFSDLVLSMQIEITKKSIRQCFVSIKGVQTTTFKVNSRRIIMIH